MYKFVGALLLLLFSITGFCQALLPGENQIMNARIVKFTVPAAQVGTATGIEVAMGMFTDEAVFRANIISTKQLTGGKAIIELPHFRANYTWRLTGKGTHPTDFHHFFTGSHPGIDTMRYRVRVTAPYTGTTPFYFFSDETKVLYDQEGEPIWYLPAVPGLITEVSMIRDLKLTPFHTITFINNDNIFEISWEGKILWSGPNNSDKSNTDIGVYHHEFTRLPNGHYMVLTNETVFLDGHQQFKLRTGNKSRDSSNIRAGFALRDSKKQTDNVSIYANIVEYNQQGEVVWKWQSYPYFQKMLSRQSKDEIFTKNAHANSFWFDIKKQQIYISYRDCSEVLKLDYPSGRVTAEYGGCCTCQQQAADTLFCGQHSVSLGEGGNVLIFNNNSCDPSKTPKMLLCKQLPGSNASLKVLFQMTLPVNYPAEYQALSRHAPSGGGNIIQLAPNRFFVSNCPPYGDISMFNMDKKVLWSVITETNVEGQWRPLGQYRASIITSRAALDQLIAGGK